MPRERLTGVRGDDPASRADEQISSEGTLELADLVRNGWLRHSERLRSSGERAQLGCGAEAPNLLERQKLCF